MYGPPVPLGGLHVIEPFDCGKDPLNIYLKQYAGQNEKRGGSRTYVVADRSNRVVGYYTLAVGSIAHTDAPLAIKKGLGQYPIPVIILARLAIDRSIQKQRYGSALLKDALKRTFNVSREVGVRAVLVHAKDSDARNWYKKYGFVESCTDDFHLLLLIQDIEKNLLPPPPKS
jgi:GNAT superfamily N-acetyltransferase